jgi:hypothetical protein
LSLLNCYGVPLDPRAKCFPLLIFGWQEWTTSVLLIIGPERGESSRKRIDGVRERKRVSSPVPQPSTLTEMGAEHKRLLTEAAQGCGDARIGVSTRFNLAALPVLMAPIQ